MDKQCTVEHDQLIHAFERLTTDPDGLLGVLENTLQEYGDSASFEAKKLLCALFQVQIDCLYNIHSCVIILSQQVVLLISSIGIL